MSRIGNLPILLKDLQTKIEGRNIVVLQKGSRSLKVKVRPEIEIQIKGEHLLLKRKNDFQKTRAFHGLYRALLNNAVLGLTQGWSKSLQLNGVGYKASVSGRKLELNLGFSHPISFDIPEGIDMKVEKQTLIHINGADRQQVGQIASKIRNLRPPEPYLGKGVKYVDEVIRKKSGKSGAEKK